MIFTLHEKPYFPSPGISWKAQKGQVRKDRISHHQKVQNKTFLVTSKYHLSINFLTQKRPYFSSPKSSKEELSAISKYHLFINFLAQKKTVFPIFENIKTRAVISKYHISINFLAKGHHIFHLQKIQNWNFLAISKHDIPC